MTLGPLAVAATFTTYLTAVAVNSLTALKARIATTRPDTHSTTERGGTSTMTDTQNDIEIDTGNQTRRRSLPLRLLALAIAALLGAALLAGCTPATHHTTTVTTVADDGTVTMLHYGENGHCYYVDSPAEATALIAAGLCPAGWTPYQMPTYWEDEYWYYYDSPAYTRYVPVARRATYNTTIINFQKSNGPAIAAASKRATYKTSTGNTVTGTPTAKLKFGNDDSFGAPGTKNGGGNLRGTIPSASTSAPSASKPAPSYSKPATSSQAPGGNLRGTAPAKAPVGGKTK